MTGEVCPFPLYSWLVFTVFFGLHGAAASLEWVARPCTDLCCNALLQE